MEQFWKLRIKISGPSLLSIAEWTLHIHWCGILVWISLILIFNMKTMRLITFEYFTCHTFTLRISICYWLLSLWFQTKIVSTFVQNLSASNSQPQKKWILHYASMNQELEVVTQSRLFHYNFRFGLLTFLFFAIDLIHQNICTHNSYMYENTLNPKLFVHVHLYSVSHRIKTTLIKKLYCKSFWSVKSVGKWWIYQIILYLLLEIV